eukprot:756169-Hanusia_phi.AAC.3
MKCMSRVCPCVAGRTRMLRRDRAATCLSLKLIRVTLIRDLYGVRAQAQAAESIIAQDEHPVYGNTQQRCYQLQRRPHKSFLRFPMLLAVLNLAQPCMHNQYMDTKCLSKDIDCSLRSFHFTILFQHFWCKNSSDITKQVWAIDLQTRIEAKWARISELVLSYLQNILLKP